MMLLQRGDADLSPAQRLDALNGGGKGLHRSEAGHSSQHGGGADLVTVEPRPGVAERRVDDEVHLAGPDAFDDGRLSLGTRAVTVLAHDGCEHTVASQHLRGAV